MWKAFVGVASLVAKPLRRRRRQADPRHVYVVSRTIPPHQKKLGKPLEDTTTPLLDDDRSLIGDFMVTLS